MGPGDESCPVFLWAYWKFVDVAIMTLFRFSYPFSFCILDSAIEIGV
jgi:hypothetical protein